MKCDSDTLLYCIYLFQKEGASDRAIIYEAER